MPITFSEFNVNAGESLVIRAQGSLERCIEFAVSDGGLCFVTGPSNSNAKVYKLTVDGPIEVSMSERDRILGR